MDEDEANREAGMLRQPGGFTIAKVPCKSRDDAIMTKNMFFWSRVRLTRFGSPRAPYT